MLEYHPEIFSSLSLEIQVMFRSKLLYTSVLHMRSVLCLCRYAADMITTYGVRWVTINYMQYVALTQPLLSIHSSLIIHEKL